jgi:hypothetical protein
MKITDYKLVDGVPLINQYLKSGYTIFGSPYIEPNGRVMQVMVFEPVEETAWEKEFRELEENARIKILAAEIRALEAPAVKVTKAK